MSRRKPVAMLTDFHMTYIFFWIGPSEDTSHSVIYGIKFDDIHKASTFACILLAQSVNSEQIQTRLPLLEKRVIIKRSTYNVIDYDDDIANLDDFADEMDPEERASYEATKKLRRFLPFVPPMYHEWYCKIISRVANITCVT